MAVIWSCIICSHLDETAKSVFKENARVTEALASHIDEADQLRDQVRRLEYENRQLRNDQELTDLLVQQKVAQSRRNKQTIKEVARCGNIMQCSRNSGTQSKTCLLYTSPSPRDGLLSRMPSSA